MNDLRIPGATSSNEAMTAHDRADIAAENLSVLLRQVAGLLDNAQAEAPRPEIFDALTLLGLAQREAETVMRLGLLGRHP